jgi:hypothetical protein
MELAEAVTDLCVVDDRGAIYYDTAEAAALIQSSFEAWERERKKPVLSDDAECRVVIRQINALTGIEDKVTFLQSFLAYRQSASEPSGETGGGIKRKREN